MQPIRWRILLQEQLSLYKDLILMTDFSLTLRKSRKSFLKFHHFLRRSYCRQKNMSQQAHNQYFLGVISIMVSKIHHPYRMKLMIRKCKKFALLRMKILMIPLLILHSNQLLVIVNSCQQKILKAIINLKKNRSILTQI